MTAASSRARPRILFYSSLPLYPDCGGGAELFVHELLSTLLARGYDCSAICHSGSLSGTRNPVKDSRLPYPVWQVNTGEPEFRQHLRTLLGRQRPHVLFGQYFSQENDLEILEFMASHRNCPVLLYLHVTHLLLLPDFELDRNITPIANSPFTAELARRHFHRYRIPVITPLITKPLIKTEEGHENKYVTFVNPVPEKGVELVAELAETMPEEKFCIVKGKWIDKNYGMENEFMQRFSSMPNVRIMDFCPERSFFSETRILLVPSRVKESFCRVAHEAQALGIPVIASARGALPHTVGEGGMIVQNWQSAEPFRKKIRKLREKPGIYQRLSRLALENSRRMEFNPNENLEKFEKLLMDPVKSGNQ